MNLCTLTRKQLTSYPIKVKFINFLNCFLLVKWKYAQLIHLTTHKFAVQRQKTPIVWSPTLAFLDLIIAKTCKENTMVLLVAGIQGMIKGQISRSSWGWSRRKSRKSGKNSFSSNNWCRQIWWNCSRRNKKRLSEINDDIWFL